MADPEQPAADVKPEGQQPAPEPKPGDEATSGPEHAPPTEVAAGPAVRGPDPRVRRRKIFIHLVLMILLVGVYVLLLSMIHTYVPPEFVPLVVVEYDNFVYPANYMAHRDADALAKALGNNDPIKELKEKPSVKNAIADLSKARGRRLIVYLSMHARVWDDEVYLLPALADPLETRDWVRLQEVFDALDACPDRHKLLILDIMKPIAGPHRGILADQVADRVEAMLRDPSAPLKFHVLCACSRGQQSWAADELGRSILVHYLLEGLEGRADSIPQQPRTWIMAEELCRSVGRRVQRWVSTNRDAHQEPAFYRGAGKADFPVLAPARNRPSLAASTKDETPTEKPADRSPYPPELAVHWKQHDQWQSGKEDQRPLSNWPVHILEAWLLHAEQNWLAGKPTDGLRNLDAEVSRLRKTYVETRAQKRSAAGEILRPPLPRPEPKVVEEVRREFRNFLAKRLKPAAGEPAPTAQQLVRELDEPKLPALAEVVFEIARERGPTEERMKPLIEVLREIRGREAGRNLVEAGTASKKSLELLEKLAGLPADDNNEWLKESAQRALLLAKAQRDLQLTPQVLPWIKSDLDNLLRDEQLALQTLGTVRPDADGAQARRLGRLLERLTDLQSAERTLAEAIKTYDEATVWLPGYVPYLLALNKDRRSEQLKKWEEAVQGATGLAEFFGRQPAGTMQDSAIALASSNQKCRAALDDLQQKYKDQVESILPPERKPGTKRSYKTTPTNHRQLSALLSATWLKADQREELWKLERELSRELAQETAKEDQDYSPGPASPAEAERDLAHDRARVLIALLEVGGVTKAATLRRQLGDLKWDPLGKGPVQEFGKQLREVWNKDVTAQFKKLTNEESWYEADRLARIMYAFDRVVGRPSTGTDRPQAVPAMKLHGQQLVSYEEWLQRLRQ